MEQVKQNTKDIDELDKMLDEVFNFVDTCEDKETLNELEKEVSKAVELKGN
jgi:hypothetical protein